MISVIIPTLFKTDRIYTTLIELSKCNTVGEIILIDNTGLDKGIDISKVRYVLESGNTYVNPAWNKGVSLSKYDKICILNDDIWFDWEYLESISEFIDSKVGLIGMSSDNYNEPIEQFRISKILPNWKTSNGHRPIGYGCCFFIHKSNWINIPSDIKIWAGDDFLFYSNNGLSNYLIEGIRCDGIMSLTSEDKSLEIEFGPIKNNDMMLIKKQIESGLVENFLTGTIWDR